jgi:hypothetical protein
MITITEVPQGAHGFRDRRHPHFQRTIRFRSGLDRPRPRPPVAPAKQHLRLVEYDVTDTLPPRHGCLAQSPASSSRCSFASRSMATGRILRGAHVFRQSVEHGVLVGVQLASDVVGKLGQAWALVSIADAVIKAGDNQQTIDLLGRAEALAHTITGPGSGPPYWDPW